MHAPFSIPLSVLDLAPVTSGSTASEAITNSTEAIRHAERLGFTRYWVAEHHNMPGIASSAPSVLIGHLADATERIRVGSGGVMLPNHPPLVVAEQFGLLTAMHPDRIDLGIGRAPGTDPATAAALRRSAAGLSAEDFPQQLRQLIDFFEAESDGITAVPAPGNRPPLWLLGSSGYSAQVAGLLGIPFAFAHHFSAANTLPALKLYRENFRPSPELERPHAMVAAAVFCADDDGYAQEMARPGALQFLRLRQGNPGKLPTPEETDAYPYTETDHAFIQERMSTQIIGSPATVRDGIAELLEATRADELMVTNSLYYQKDRLRSLELVAGMFRN
ncbi:LLM class flavin-dependent oxidoreductase [Sciscionella marina]|uniref:LLM class flavin-dependent oxidoreductase n=1 Tax=Sciscionella marina TaxID=508770 RepID=UPI00037BECFF|nr:LLM class flavin-dependent oxidoreductase [Sciscionella marina]